MADSRAFKSVQSLVTEGLKVGGFLKGAGVWESFHGGQRLLIRDKKVGENRDGMVAIAEELSSSLLMSSALSDLPNHVIIGMRLAADIDLSKVRAERLRHASRIGESYWAVYIVEDSMLVSLGVPFSSSRLVGEILKAQLGHPFEQRRVCAECGALNPYRAKACNTCNAKLVSTGRLNRWMHYDDEETSVRKLTPDERKKLLGQLKDATVPIVHPWKEETLKHKSAEEILSAPTMRILRPRTDHESAASQDKKTPSDKNR